MSGNEQKNCFVIMPYGEKSDAEGHPINFDEIFEYIITPPLKQMKMHVTRCDKIQNAGSIHRDMLHHILHDDLAIVDITTLNPNVFYELGVRHTLHRSGTILIRKKGTRNPFNIQGMRTLEYDTGLASANQAKEMLQASIKSVLAGDHTDSLVYDIFPKLKLSMLQE
jgi:hypothetical protein